MRTWRACGTRCQKLVDGIGGDHVAGAAGDQQGRHRDAPRGREQLRLMAFALGGDHLQQRRIPMPAQAAIVTEAQQRSQLRRGFALPTLRQVGRDRVGRSFIEEAKPSGYARMKARMRSTPADSQRGVMSTSTSARSGGCLLAPATVMPSRPPIEAPTSTGGRGSEPRQPVKIGNELVEMVGTAGHAIAFAVPARVEADRLPARLCQRLCRTGPGLASLAETVSEQHGWRHGIAPALAGQGRAIGCGVRQAFTRDSRRSGAGLDHTRKYVKPRSPCQYACVWIRPPTRSTPTGRGCAIAPCRQAVTMPACRNRRLP